MLTSITGSDTSAAQMVVRLSFSASSKRAFSSRSLDDAPSAPPAPSALSAPSSKAKASYPALRTSSISICGVVVDASKSTAAVSVEKFTEASTPSSLLSLRCTRDEHDEHVIPVTPSSMCCSAVGVWVGLWVIPPPYAGFYAKE